MLQSLFSLPGVKGSKARARHEMRTIELDPSKTHKSPLKRGLIHESTVALASHLALGNGKEEEVE